jgi:hypothetical protein
MPSLKPANRRDFLGKLTGTAALMGAASLLNPTHANDITHALSGNTPDPDEWFKGLKGKHRLLFDCTAPKEIFPFAWPEVFISSNIHSGASEKDCSAVVVFRSSACVYALQDALWAKYKLGELLKIMDPQTKTFAVRNPFWKPKPEDFMVPGIGALPLGFADLQAMGIMFCVCNVALTTQSAKIAISLNQDAETIKKEWIAGMIPDVALMPSGVWAVGRAQEHGCGYCYV